MDRIELFRFTAGAIFGLGVIFGIVMCAALLLARPAAAHGWYDIDCCSNKDCRPTQAGEVERWAELVNGTWREGFRHVDTGKVWWRGDRWLRQSKDGQDHICWPPGNQMPLCFYEGPNG